MGKTKQKDEWQRDKDGNEIFIDYLSYDRYRRVTLIYTGRDSHRRHTFVQKSEIVNKDVGVDELFRGNRG